MDSHEAAIEWCNYVRENYNRLKAAVSTVEGERELLSTRQIMAELGKEITPSELREFGELLKTTLKIIENESK